MHVAHKWELKAAVPYCKDFDAIETGFVFAIGSSYQQRFESERFAYTEVHNLGTLGLLIGSTIKLAGEPRCLHARIRSPGGISSMQRHAAEKGTRARGSPAKLAADAGTNSVQWCARAMQMR